MSAIFDIDDVAVVTKDGLHKNTPVVIKKLCHTYKTPYNTDIFYDCETTDDPPRTIVVNEKDLISFEQYLDDVGALDLLNADDDYDGGDPLAIIESWDLELEAEEYLDKMIAETDSKKQCECGAEKTQVGNHSTWCPKYA